MPQMVTVVINYLLYPEMKASINSEVTARIYTHVY